MSNLTNKDTSLYIKLNITEINPILSLYIKYQNKIGSYWALYLIGINKISNIKISLFEILFNF